MRTGRIGKLAADLGAAAQAARSAAHGASDGGSANHDAVSIKLKGWRESVVERAASLAGCSARRGHGLSRGRFVVSFPGGGQGASRTAAQQAACAALVALGYDAYMHWVVD